jgi:hypothetical protein
LRFQKRLLIGCDFALNELQLNITAKDRAALIGQSARHRLGQGVDACNRGDTQRDTGQKNRKAAQPTAQLAHGVGEAQGQGGWSAIRAWSRDIRHQRTLIQQSVILALAAGIHFSEFSAIRDGAK